MNDWKPVAPKADDGGWKPVAPKANDDAWKPVASAPSHASNFQPAKGNIGLNQLRALWLAQGGAPKAADLMAHVGFEESAGNTNASNFYVDAGQRHYVRGLWQESDVHGQHNYNDPAENARIAAQLYKAQGLSPWEDSRHKGATGGWAQYLSDPSVGFEQKAARIAQVTPPPKTSIPHSKLLAGVDPRAAFKPLAHVANAGFVNSMQTADWARHHPGDAAMSVLGALQRGAASAIGDVADKDTWNLTNGKWMRLPGDVWGGIMHPEQKEAILQRMEHGIFHDLGLDGLEHAANSNGLAKFVKDFAMETLSDPTTYIPGADIFSVGARLTRVAGAASHGAQAARGIMGLLAKSNKPAAKQLYKAITDWNKSLGSAVSRTGNVIKGLGEKRRDLSAHFTGTGKMARMSLESSTANHAYKSIRENADFLNHHANQLKGIQWGAGQLDPIFQKHLLMEAWRYGSAGDRAEVEQMLRNIGQSVSPDDLKAFPRALGLIDYKGSVAHNFMDAVLPSSNKLRGMLTPEVKKAADNLLQHSGLVNPFNPMNSVAIARNAHEVMQDRLLLGTDMVRRLHLARGTADLIKQYGQSVVHAVPSQSNLQHWALHNIKDSAHNFASYKVGGEDMAKIAKKMSGLYRNGILLNPIPHGLVNMGSIALMRGGLPTVARALKYIATGGAPKHIVERLEALGGKTNFWTEPTKLSGPLSPLFQKSQGVMDYLETAWRASYLQHLDSKMGILDKTDPNFLLHELIKGQTVATHMGDYENPTHLVEIMKNFGGLFDTFRFTVIPSAALHSIKGRAGLGITALGRFQDRLSDQTMPQGYHLNFIGPWDDFSKATGDPFNYLMSVSTLGPVLGTAAAHMRHQDDPQHGRVNSGVDDFNAIADWLIPGYGGFVKYDDPRNMAPTWIRFWMQFGVGGYTTRNQSSKTERTTRKAFDRARAAI